MDFNENKPIYIQLAEQIMDEVLRKDLAIDNKLPSVREYATKTGVNPNTVNRSYTWLQDQGIIFNKRGIGYFFEYDAKQKVIDQRQRQFIEIEMPEFIKKWVKLGVSPSRFSETYNLYYEKHIKGEF